MSAGNFLLFNIEPPSLVSRAAGQRRKTEGQNRATYNAEPGLTEARQIAAELCRRNGETSSDQVRTEYERRHGGSHLGNAWGSLFADGRFEWTGRVTESEIASAHSRIVKVWRIKESK